MAFVGVIAIIIFIALMIGMKDTAEGIDNGTNASGAQDSSQLPPQVNNHPYTQDDIIHKNGHYYENENSEDWEEFEYEISEDERFK